MGVYSYPDGKGGQVELNFDVGSKKVLGPNGEELATFQRYPNGQFGITIPNGGGTLYLDPITGVATSAETGKAIQGKYVFGQNELGTAFGGSPSAGGDTSTTPDSTSTAGGDTSTTPDSTSTSGTNNVYSFQGHDYYLNPSDNQFYGDADFTQGTGVYLNNGQVTDINGTPVMGGFVNGNKVTLNPNAIGQVSYTGPDGKQTNLTLTSDRRVLDATGTAVGTYNTSGPGQYSLSTLDGKPFATYDSNSGIVTFPGGSAINAGFTSSGNNLPDVSQVEGPTTTNKSESTSYSGMGPQYAPTISGWMSNLNESLQPQAYHDLISGSYDTARGQVGRAYDTAQEQVPGLYDTARGQVGRAYTAAQGQIPGIYNTARGQAKQGFQEAQDYLPEVYQQRVSPMLQGAINSLVKRNILDSTVGGNTIANAANLAYQSILPQQTALAGQEAGVNANLAGQEAGALTGLVGTRAGALTGLAGQEAGAGTSLAGVRAAQQSGLANKEAAYQTAYPATLASATGNLGKYTQTHTTSSGLSKNPLAPYALVYGTIPYMAQSGNG